MVDTPTTTQTGPARRPVCVVTARTDETADAIIVELEKLGAPVLRFDLADFPHHVQLDAQFDGTWRGTINTGDRTMRLEDLGAVLWRHPGTARLNTPVATDLTDAETEWASREATAGLAGVLAALDCLHLNHPAAIHAAQSKPIALTAAAQAGLTVPPLWIGNSPPAASAFATTANGIVCKSLTVPGIDEHRLFFSTTRIDTTDIGESLALTAHQLQHFIDKHFEVRLTVVGNQMFAARIDAHSPAAHTDFRDDYDALTYQHVDLPEQIRTGVAAWMRNCGLLYAAIDLLVDRDDRWWAIDLNPAGQYGWIEHHLPDLTISAAIAKLLATPTPSSSLGSP